MKEIKTKITELLIASKEETDSSDSFEGIFKKMYKQDQLIEELKVLAKANNTLLGRTIKFPKADSFALYVVTKINSNTVVLTWVDYCDGWIDDRCGYESLVNIDYVTQHIKGDDALEELFSRHNVQ